MEAEQNKSLIKLKNIKRKANYFDRNKEDIEIGDRTQVVDTELKRILSTREPPTTNIEDIARKHARRTMLLLLLASLTLRIDPLPKQH